MMRPPAGRAIIRLAGFITAWHFCRRGCWPGRPGRIVVAICRDMFPQRRERAACGPCEQVEMNCCLCSRRQTIWRNLQDLLTGKERVLKHRLDSCRGFAHADTPLLDALVCISHRVRFCFPVGLSRPHHHRLAEAVV